MGEFVMIYKIGLYGRISSTILGCLLGISIIMNCGNDTDKDFKGSVSSGKSYRLIYNNDGTYVLSNALHEGRPLTIEDVEDYVNMIENTPVTTYAICSNSLMPYYESKFDRSIGCLNDEHPDTAKGSTTTENMRLYGKSVLALREQGTDIIEICVNRTKKLGLEAFVTMRMNDLHFNDVSVRNPLEQSDFWLDHPEFYVGEHPGWNATGALNFAHEEVRQYKLNMIREICEGYDLDGLELDFMRFPVYFPYGEGENYLDVMTDFVADARSIADEAGQRRGRPILLTVRVPSRMDFCLSRGFDVRTWVEKGLVDFITLSAFFTDDPILPVREFIEALGPAEIGVYGSLENGVHSPREPRTHGLYRAAAAHMLASIIQGTHVLIDKQELVHIPHRVGVIVPRALKLQLLPLTSGRSRNIVRDRKPPRAPALPEESALCAEELEHMGCRVHFRKPVLQECRRHVAVELQAGRDVFSCYGPHPSG